MARRMGFQPGAWYRAAAPQWRTSAPAGPVIRVPTGNVQLPLVVDLVGTRAEIAEGMEWRPVPLARGTYLERLNLHYMEYLHRLQPHDAVRIMEDWTSRVPPYERGYWRDSWNSYALSIRVVVWLDILTLHGTLFDKASRNVLEQSAAAQLRFLERNLETDIGGNHLMKNLRALLRGGSCFEGPEPQRWVHRAIARLDAEITEQILPDGMHFELSPAYHLQVMEDLMDMRRALRSLEGAEGFAKRCARARRLVDETLRKMAYAMTLTTHPDGLPSQFADGGLHMAAEPSTILDYLTREGIMSAATPARHSGPWRLEYGGYVGFSGPGELFMCDCGEVGAAHLPAHGHGDALSIEWSVCGHRFIIDPGVYEYHSGPRRAYSRSTAAHNTVTIDDKDQSEFWSSFRVGNRARVTVERWEPTREGFILVASHDGYRKMSGGPIHVRQIEAAPGKIIVEDEVRGGLGQPVRARVLFAPGVTIESITCFDHARSEARLSIPAADRDGNPIRACLRANVALRLEVADSSPDFGVNVPANRLVLELGAAPCSARWSVEIQ